MTIYEVADELQVLEDYYNKKYNGLWRNFILQQYKNIPDEEYKNIYDVNYVKSDTTLDDAVVTAEAKNRVFMGYEMGVNPLSTTDFYYEENDGIIEYFLDKIYTPTEAESIFGKEELLAL